MVTLWDHQREHVDRDRSELVQNRRVIMSAPPGTGKTRMAKFIISQKLNGDTRNGYNGRALFCVHRRGLVANACNSFLESPALNHGVIMSGHPTAFNCRFQVASIDTLNSWWLKSDGYRGYTFDLIVFDECHSHCASLQKFLKLHDEHRAGEGLKTAFVLGLSATPQGEGLADVFASIVPGPEPAWLIEKGFLKPFRYYNGTRGNLDLLVKRGQRFTTESNISAMGGLAGDLVRDWKHLAAGRSTVGFFPNRSQAREAMQLLRQAGIDAQYVDGETPDTERNAIFKCLGNGSIDYICNVGVIERGTDIPRIGCVQLCTAVGSLVRYRQMIGRGSRPHDDARDCLVIDHADNVKRHGFFDDPIQWSLEAKVTEAKIAAEGVSIECPKCGRQYRGGRCVECDYQPTQEERKKQGLTFTGTTLKEVTAQSKPAGVYSDEKILLNALFAMKYKNATWRQTCGVAASMAKKHGKKWRCPKTFTVGGKSYRSITYGSPFSNYRIKDLFPFLGK